MDFENLKLLVVLITYNHKDVVRRAIDSVLSQETNFPYKLIIADDASNDGSQEIMEEYRSKYSDKIIYLRNEVNTGAPQLFIDLLTKIELPAQYMALIEGDDQWCDDHKLQHQVDFLDQNPDYVLVTHDAKNVDTDNHLIDLYSDRYFIPDTLTHTEILEKNRLPTSAYLFRAIGDYESFKGYWTERYNSDWILTLYLATQGKIKFIDKVWSVRYILPTGANSTISHDKYLNFQIATLKRLKQNTFYKQHQNDVNYALAARYLKALDFKRDEHAKFDLGLFLHFIYYLKPTSWKEIKFAGQTILKRHDDYFLRSRIDGSPK